MQAWKAWTFAPWITINKAPVLTKGRGRNLVVPPFFTVCSHKLPFKYTHPVKIIQSICEYSDKITAATPLQSTFAKSQVRCRAQRGIPYKLPLRLSPAGYSLLVSLISTCSPQRWYTEYNNVIKKCQVIIFTILTPLAFSFNVCITTRKDDTALRDQIQKAMIVYFGIRQMGFTDLYFELKMQSTKIQTKNRDAPYKSLPIFIIS